MPGRRSRETVPFSLFAFQDIITSVTGIVIFLTLVLTLELVSRVSNSPSRQTASLAADVEKALTEARNEIAELKLALENGSESLLAVASVSAHKVDQNLYETGVQITRLRSEIARLVEHSRQLADQKTAWNAKRFEGESDRKRLDELHERAKELRAEIDTLTKTNRVIFNPTDVTRRAWIIELSQAATLIAEAGVQAVPFTFDSPNRELRARATLDFARQRDPRKEYFVILIRPGTVDAFRDLYRQLLALDFRVGFDLLSAEQVAIDPVSGAGPPPISP